MFESLGNRLDGALKKLTGRGVLSEKDVGEAMREVRVALLEADVALPVVKEFIEKVREEAVGEAVIRSIKPGQMVVKIVQDRLTELLGSEQSEINLLAEPPVVILMAGLQGSGKTTSTAKLARWLREKQGKKVMMASLDVYRPAAQTQLKILGEQVAVETLPIVEGEKPQAITKRALQAARLSGMDVLMLDTAGRLHVDDALMGELKEVAAIANPTETLLVADALTGQDAVTTAQAFAEAVALTGIILTRLDGDGRGGAALSMKHVTGCPVKFAGVGEKVEDFEPFHPERVAQRILGMGDVVSLVEKASEQISEDDAKRMVKKLKSGQFDFNDLNEQFEQLKKLGGMGSLMGMIPGLGKLKGQMSEAGMDSSLLRQQAIIQSMTKKERGNPDLLNTSRKRRIASGCGMTIQDVNRLVKQHKQMQLVMKKMGKKGKRGGMPDLGALTGGGGMPGMPGGMPGGAGNMNDLLKGLGGGAGMPSLPPGFKLPK